MPLSEEELRLLEQMERALAAEDPKFASTLRGTIRPQGVRQRVVLSVVGFVIGVGLLLGGSIANLWWLGLAGFLLMLAAAVVGLASYHGGGGAGSPGLGGAGSSMAGGSGFRVVQGGRKGRGTSRPSRGTFLQRMERRWERRRNQGF